MPTQLEILKEQLTASEARSGADNPFVQGLKAQIAAAERTEWRRAHGGWFGPVAPLLVMPVTSGD